MITPEDALACRLLGGERFREYLSGKYPCAYEVRARGGSGATCGAQCTTGEGKMPAIGWLFECTRPAGHEGTHVAHVGPGEAVHAW
jgi:hypothetical protein